MEIKQGNFSISGKEFYQIEVYLPKTTLLIVGNSIGYFMCGALDVEMFSAPHLLERKVICGKAVRVKTIDELLEGRLHSITKAAEEKGISLEMTVKEALLLLK